MAQFKSKHGTVCHSQAELYMTFTDMRNFLMMIPEDKKSMVTADYDTLRVTYQGFNIGVKITGRVPYDLIQMQDDNAPFHFGISLHFDRLSDVTTDFHIEMDADLNVMMKMMMGSRIQEALDKIVDALSSR